MVSCLTIYIILQGVAAAIAYAQSANHVADGSAAGGYTLLGPGHV